MSSYFWHYYCGECGHISLAHHGQGCEEVGCKCQLTPADMEELDKAERLGDRDREEPDVEPDDWPEPDGQRDLFTNSEQDAAEYERRQH